MTDSKPLTSEEIAELIASVRRDHVVNDLDADGAKWCVCCQIDGGEWPCETIRLASALAQVVRDKERLDWLERSGNGIGLVHDDEEAWAVVNSGVQSIRSTLSPDDPWDTAFMVFPGEDVFRPTVRAAIDAAIAASPARGEEKS